MVHTLPDYTTKYKMATVFGNIDSGELAARLGSINTFDRRGDTIWMEDFNSPVLTWSQSEIGAGSAVVLTADEKFRGSQSVSLTAGPAARRYGMIKHGINPLRIGKLGLEISVRPSPFDSYIQISIDIDDAINHYVSILRYDTTDGTIDIWDGDPDWTSVPGAHRISPLFHSFSPFKFVIDTSTGKYVRAMLGRTQWDLSSYSMQSTALGPYQTCLIVIYNEAQGAAAATAYVDGVIVTQNEP